MSDSLLLSLNLFQRQVLIYGNGASAAAKIRLFKKTTAEITVFYWQPPTEELVVELARLEKKFIKADETSVEALNAVNKKKQKLNIKSGFILVDEDWIQSQPEIINDFFLRVAATDSKCLNSSFVDHCKQRNLLVAGLGGDLSFPAIIDRDPVQVAFSTQGLAPTLSRLWRTQLEMFLPTRLGDLARFCQRFRPQIKLQLPEAKDRQRFWQSVLGGPIGQAVLAGNQASASKKLTDSLADGKSVDWQSVGESSVGEVFLVGAGPGDPELLTIKALRLIQQADVVLYDRLVSPKIMDLCRRDAKLVYVGKKTKFHSVPQENINQQLVDLAKSGYKVLRLKGGDPFIFGRGGEEIEHLAQHEVPFQVIPGITSAVGCGAYAGIPLTHRDHAQSVRFVTAHLHDKQLSLPWASLAEPGQTLVFYMGLTSLETICQQLILAGSPRHMPAACIEAGTTEKQQVIMAELESLSGAVKAASLQAPCIIIVGSVVSLREKLRWFAETKKYA